MFQPKEININKVKEELDKIAYVSRAHNGGVTRCTFNTGFLKSASIIADWMNEIGLKVYFDRWGNLYGRYECVESESYILTGSHLDSVKNGGNFDGLLGIISSIEAVRMIKESGLEIKKNIEVVAFIEEEGNVFQKILLGSLLATGQLSDSEIGKLRNADNEPFLDVVSRLNLPYPIDPNKILNENVESYIELHLEQAKLLEANQKSVGLVTSIAGLKFFRIHLIGQSDHAGSTAYVDRRDTLLAASEVILELRRIGVEQFPDSARLTVGKINVIPDMTNVVAGETFFNIDTRSADIETSEKVEREVRLVISRVCHKHELKYEIEVLSDSPAAISSKKMRTAIKKGMVRAGVSHLELVSWAVHDALVMSKTTNMGMIFVRCLDGRSHCPEEFVSPEDIADGISVLANTLVELANHL